MRTTILMKNCHTCADAMNGKCPLTFQHSPVCPKKVTKTLATPIMNVKEEKEKLLYMFAN
jgi:hypothetical protein